MIRINLLPVKAAKKRATGQRQLALAAVLIVVCILGTTVYHMAEASDLDRMKDENKEIKAAIAKLKVEVGDYDTVRKQKEKLIRQRDTIKALQASRGGPVHVLRELSEIITKDRGPTFDKEHYEELLRRDPNAGYNPSWDPRRVWIMSMDFSAKDVQLVAGAKSNEDVAEYMKRLELSVFFDGVQLSATTANGSGSGKWYGFGVRAGVKY